MNVDRSARQQKWVSTEVKSFADHTENATPLEKIDKTDKIENNKNCNLEKARVGSFDSYVLKQVGNILFFSLSIRKST